ncbi:ANTAR domain-containing protein [Streptomyces flavofungini]|uniref:ANTAR domain-containing protein n=1 Tax=Streptomyces flavofungini TaxID=68200 RepID=UPI0034DFF9E4
MEKSRLQLVAEACTELGCVVRPESEWLLGLAKAYLLILPVEGVRTTLADTGKHAHTGRTTGQMAAVLELRHHGEFLGVVELLATGQTPLAKDDLSLGQTLADLAAAGLDNRRGRDGLRARTDTLQHDLDEKIVTEQATGMIAQLTYRNAEQAGALLRAQSTHSGKSVCVLAREIVDGFEASCGQTAQRWPSWVIRHQIAGGADDST